MERNEFTFPASILKQGENTLTLRAIVSGNDTASLLSGLMYDTIVLETD